MTVRKLAAAATLMSTLILIPTHLEAIVIRTMVPDSLTQPAFVELCGFGPIAAAARTAALIAEHQPRRVLLAGIAGSYDDRFPLGSARQFGSVGCYGIGAGAGNEFQTAEDLGWNHFHDRETGATIGDVLPLSANSQSAGRLLTVCAAAAGSAEVSQRRKRFPDAVAEDMEGFAVAAACKLAGIELSVVRGISNRAGDRNLSNWQIKPALNAAGKLMAKLLVEHEDSGATNR